MRKLNNSKFIFCWSEKFSSSTPAHGQYQKLKQRQKQNQCTFIWCDTEQFQSIFFLLKKKKTKVKWVSLYTQYTFTLYYCRYFFDEMSTTSRIQLQKRRKRRTKNDKIISTIFSKSMQITIKMSTRDRFQILCSVQLGLVRLQIWCFGMYRARMTTSRQQTEHEKPEKKRLKM